MPSYVDNPGGLGVRAMAGRGRIERSKASNCCLLAVYDVPKVAQVGCGKLAALNLSKGES